MLFRSPLAQPITTASGVQTTQTVNSDDFQHLMAGLDFNLSWGHIQLFAEGLISVWEVPNLSENRVTAVMGYGELQWAFYPRWSLAGRYDLA